MLNATLLLAAIGPRSQEWSPTVAIVMSVCTALGIFAASVSKKAGPAVGTFTVAQIIGGASLGQLIGVGATLGLTRLGII
jgi:photosystem I subunit X